MIKNKTIIIFLFLFLSACGYQIVNSTKNNNIYIADYSLDGDKFINRILGKNFSKNNNIAAKKRFTINTFSTVEKTINSKNKSGESISHTININIEFEILKDNNIIKVLELKESNSYNASENKFEQKQYERVLIENMVQNILIIFYQNLIEI